MLQNIWSVVTNPKHLFVRALLVEPDDVAFIEDGMVAATDDVGTDNDTIIDSIVLPVERRALQSIDRGRTWDEKRWEYLGPFS